MTRLMNIEVGKKLDIRSHEQIWCVGVIRRISYKQESQLRTLYVHFEVAWM